MLATDLPSNPPSRARGSSLFRTVVVAVATLTVVLLGFSIYQSTQQPPPARETTPILSKFELTPASGKGVEIGPGVRIGSGKGPVLSIYPPQGTEAVAEVETASYFPVDETGNELKLVSPLVRLRTKAGQRINIRSNEGLIQINSLNTSRGKRQEWQRGKLMGDVVVEIDRLGDAERDALPPDQRDALTPERLIRIAVDEIEFDLEYNHVRVAGPFSVVSHEIELDAVGLDLRLDPSGSRIETLRILQGQRLVVRAPAESLSMMVDADATTGVESTSWLDVIRAGMPAAAPPAPTASLASTARSGAVSPPTTAPGKLDEEGALIIGTVDPSSKRTSHERTTYQAHFENDVVAVHERGQERLGRLQANVLDILKDISEVERGAVGGLAPKPGVATDAATEKIEPLDTLTLTWTGPLTLTTLPPEPARTPDEDRLEVRAKGEPVIVSDATGQATCRDLVFLRQSREIRLTGDDESRVVLDNHEQGAIHAVAMTSTEADGKRRILFTGPGKLVSARPASVAAPPADVTENSAAPGDGETESGVVFKDRMELDMQRVVRKTLDVRHLSTVTSESMVPSQARFFGQVVMHDGENRIAADDMVLNFQPDVDEMRIRSLAAEGHVDARLGDGPGSAITGRRLEVDFNTAHQRVTPLQARALGDVVARHDGGVMSADDRIVFDFVSQTQVRKGRLDLLAAYIQARLGGDAPEGIDWTARRRDAESTTQTLERVRLSRILAVENVAARDDRRKLDLHARRLDCTLDDQQQIDTAVVDGALPDDAYVQLGALTVKGPTIRVSASAQDVAVPGAGSLAFLSQRDLDGRELKSPTPIRVNWTQSMTFAGHENRAVFNGAVHAASQRHSFDAARVEVGFVDAAPAPAPQGAQRDWWILSDLMDRSSSKPASADEFSAGRLDKQAVLLAADGDVVAVMAHLDEVSGAVLSRAQLTGDSLVVDRRAAPGHMRMDGAGTLLMEDYEARASASQGPGTGLLAIGAGSDRSQTAVTWTSGMNYDFDKDRALFTGDVNLRHLSGKYLVLQDKLVAEPQSADDGRSTSLSCKSLSVDFASDNRIASVATASAGMGEMDARRIRQFRASGNVSVTDPKFTLDAEDVVYNRASQQLLIEGTDAHHAEAFQLRDGELPRHLTARRLSLDLQTSTFTIIEPVGEGS